MFIPHIITPKMYMIENPIWPDHIRYSNTHIKHNNTPSRTRRIIISCRPIWVFVRTCYNGRAARTQPLTQKFSCWRTSTRSCHTGQPIRKCNGWASPWRSRLLDREKPPSQVSLRAMGGAPPFRCCWRRGRHITREKETQTVREAAEAQRTVNCATKQPTVMERQIYV